MNNEQKIKEENTKCNCGCESDNCKCDSTCDCGCNEGKQCTCDNSELKRENHHTMKHKDKFEQKLIESNKKIEDLSNKIKELEEKLTRTNADMINYRKRKEEEVSRMLKYSNEDLIKALLPTIDNFERAIKLDDDNLEDEVSKFLEGFKMVYCNFNQVLDSFEIKTIEESNVEFDPIYHNAIMVEKREGVKSGVVLEVLQKGYMLKDKVIRPAMVKVSE